MGSRGPSQMKRKAFSNRFLSRQFEIGIVTSGSVVGEACLFGADFRSEVAVVAHTNLSVLILERDDLTKHLHLMDIEKLKDSFKPRSEWHKEHFSKITSTVFALQSETKSVKKADEEKQTPDGLGLTPPPPKKTQTKKKKKRFSTTLPPLGDDFIPPSSEKSLDFEKKALLSAKNIQILRNQKVPQSVLLAYSAIMNTKESLSVKIAHRHMTSLGTSFFKHQMIREMKPDIVIPERFCRTIRSKPQSYKDLMSMERSEEQSDVNVNVNALASTLPILRGTSREDSSSGVTFMTEPELT